MTPTHPDSSFIGWLIVLLVIGAACYVADRRIGTGIYRWWHDMTSKKKLGKDTDVGFLYNRRARARFSVAVFLGVVHSVAAVWFSHVSPVVQLITFAVEVPALMAGFYLGPIAYRLWERKDPLLDVVDDLEQGKTTVGDVVKAGTARAQELVRRRFGSDDEAEVSDQAAGASASPRPQLTVVPKPSVAPPPAEDPQAMQDQFINPKGGRHGGNNAA